MTKDSKPIPNPFDPRSSFGDETNADVSGNEAERGVHIDDLVNGTFLRISTTDHAATLVKWGENDYQIWGHPELYPKPTKIRIIGSTWGGMALKQHFIGIGMHLTFARPDLPHDIHAISEYVVDYNCITTAQILKIEEIEATAV